MGLRFSQLPLHLIAASAVWAAAAFLVLPPSIKAATIPIEAQFLGMLPDHRPIQVSKDQDYCGQTLANETKIVISLGRKIYVDPTKLLF